LPRGDLSGRLTVPAEETLMPALIPTAHYATVVWLGIVPHRDADEIVTHATDAVDLTFAGPSGDTHSGEVRASCSRVKAQHPKGTPIRNTRQLSIVSAEELRTIAVVMGLDAIDPAWLGATVVIEGVPDWSHVPPSSRLQAESGATVTVDMQNRPCKYPALTIEADLPGQGKSFLAAASGKRGVTAWVEREGRFVLGDRLRLHIPDQRAWRGQ